MPAKIYYDQDADLGLLRGKKVAIIGYGSQGHAHALNLKDSGQDVVVGLYKGSKSWARAEKDGLKVMSVNEAAAAGDIIMILLPDQTQRQVYEDVHQGRARQGQDAHVRPRLQHPLQPGGALAGRRRVDDRAQGPRPRDARPLHPGPRRARAGRGVPGRLGQGARTSPSPTARASGCTRAGVIETTFKEETETDLFGEQTTLCGGVSHLIKNAFETLVEAGYQPEVAYFECMHEMKLIVDLFYQGGLAYMRYSVSDTAEYGDYTRGPRIVDDRIKAEMKKILAEIQSGQFAREWILENQANRAGFLAMRKRDAEHQIEEVGARLRKMMSWIKPPRDVGRRGRGRAAVRIPVAAEGWPFIFPPAVAACILAVVGWWAAAIPLAMLALAFLGFFRDPEREIPSVPGAVLAPADGRVMAIAPRGGSLGGAGGAGVHLPLAAGRPREPRAGGGHRA